MLRELTGNSASPDTGSRSRLAVRPVRVVGGRLWPPKWGRLTTSRARPAPAEGEAATAQAAGRPG